jgi:hypothetical protein
MLLNRQPRAAAREGVPMGAVADPHVGLQA